MRAVMFISALMLAEVIKPFTGYIWFSDASILLSIMSIIFLLMDLVELVKE